MQKCKKGLILVLILSLVISNAQCVFAGQKVIYEDSQNIKPKVNSFESKADIANISVSDGINTINDAASFVKLTDDSYDGKYSLMASVGAYDKAKPYQINLLQFGQNEDVSSTSFSKARLYIKPAQGAAEITFVVNGKNANTFKVGTDLKSGQWNEIEIDLAAAAGGQKVSTLTATVNEQSVWYFDKVEIKRERIAELKASGSKELDKIDNYAYSSSTAQTDSLEAGRLSKIRIDDGSNNINKWFKNIEGKYSYNFNHLDISKDDKTVTFLRNFYGTMHDLYYTEENLGEWKRGDFITDYICYGNSDEVKYDISPNGQSLITASDYVSRFFIRYSVDYFASSKEIAPGCTIKELEYVSNEQAIFKGEKSGIAVYGVFKNQEMLKNIKTPTYITEQEYLTLKAKGENDEKYFSYENNQGKDENPYLTSIYGADRTFGKNGNCLTVTHTNTKGVKVTEEAAVLKSYIESISTSPNKDIVIVKTKPNTTKTVVETTNGTTSTNENNITQEVAGMKNLIVNGSFENGLSNWSFNSGQALIDTSKSYHSSSAVNRGNTDFYQSLTTISGHKYYVATNTYDTVGNQQLDFKLRSYEKLGRRYYNWVDHENISLTSLEKGKWERRSGIITSSGRGAINLWSNAPMNTLFMDSVILVDLTAQFGVGNEPSKEWCDEHITYDSLVNTGNGAVTPSVTSKTQEASVNAQTNSSATSTSTVVKYDWYAVDVNKKTAVLLDFDYDNGMITDLKENGNLCEITYVADGKTFKYKYDRLSGKIANDESGLEDINFSIYMNTKGPDGGYMKTKIVDLKSNVVDIKTNGNGETAFVKLQDGKWYMVDAKTKSAREMKIEMNEPEIIYVTSDNKLFLYDKNSRFMTFDPQSEKLTDIRPADAAIEKYVVAGDGGQIIYKTTANEIKVIYFNENDKKTTTKYLLSFDGKCTYQSYKNGQWVDVPETCDGFEKYGMTSAEINALTSSDFDKLYVDGRQIYSLCVELAVDRSKITTGWDPYANIKIKCYINEEASQNELQGEKTYIAKEETIDLTNVRKLQGINAIESANMPTEYIYFLKNGDKYIRYEEEEGFVQVEEDIDALLSDVRKNWVELSLIAMTRAELINLPADALTKEYLKGSKPGELKIVYAAKINESDSSKYKVSFKLNTTDNYFESENLKVVIQQNDGKTKEYSNLSKTQVEDFMEWVAGRQSNMGPVFYRLKCGNTNEFVNYYMIVNVTVQE